MANHLIIPLAGFGKRFIKGGYKTLKPFIPVDHNNNMIDLIVNNFPKDINKIFIVRKNIQKKYIKFLRKYKNSNIYFIKSHNLGPLYSVNLIKRHLEKLENIFLCYCDIHWIWKNLKPSEHKSNTVYCFRGWHPFTVDNNNYAFCIIMR